MSEKSNKTMSVLITSMYIHVNLRVIRTSWLDLTQYSDKSPLSQSSTISTRWVYSFWQFTSQWQPESIDHGKRTLWHSHIAVEQGVSVGQPHFIISSTSEGATLMFGGSVTGTLHLTRLSRSHPYSAGSKAERSDSRADLHVRPHYVLF